MQISDVPFTVTDLSKVAPSEHAGEKGTSFWHTLESGNLRIRIVEYSAGFLADHFCPRGHVFYVLEGTVLVELKDGQTFTLQAGQDFIAADCENGHRISSSTGAKVFIAD
jgi:quercetin dioxygenase-like cupin family protein